MTTTAAIDRTHRTPYRVREAREGAPTAVFVHGWMVSGRVFDALVDALPEARAIIPDLRIATTSVSAAAPSTSLDELATDVLGVADDAGAERFDLVGHSMGGQIAALAAAAAPSRVRSLVLLNPVPVVGLPLPEDVAGFFRSSGGQRSAQGAILDKACLALLAAAKDACLDDAGRIDPAWIAHAFDLWTRGSDASALEAISCPTLVVATSDPFLPPSLLDEAIVQHMKSARLETIPGLGHYPQLEGTEQTADVMRRFWASQPRVETS